MAGGHILMDKEYKEIANTILGILIEAAKEQGIKVDF